MRKLLFLTLLLCVVPAWATDPGELQDCSDWMQLQPGYTCTTFVAPPCNSTPVCEKSGTTQVVDTNGRLLFVRDVPLAGLCWPNDSASRAEIVAHDGNSEIVLGTFSDRCDGRTHIDRFRAVNHTLQFDRQRGALLIRMTSGCDYDNDNDTSCPNSDNGQASIIAIEGFPTIFEILQSTCGIDCEGGGCVPTSSKEKGPRCSDGIDNDCDGAVDGADLDCM